MNESVGFKTVSPDQEKNDISGLLSRIILLEGEIRKVENVNEFSVLSVNETHKIFPYFQCFLWSKSKYNKIRIHSVSGTSSVDSDSPAIRVVVRIVKFLRSSLSEENLTEFTATEENVPFYKEWIETFPSYVLWCEFSNTDPENKLAAGMLFFHDREIDKRTMAAARPVLDAYRYTWYKLPEVIKENKSTIGQLVKNKLTKYLVLAVIIGVMFVPVSESVLAPSSVAPYKPSIVSAPISGVINTFFVKPNQLVEIGDLLFSLEDREIKSEVVIAGQELETVRAEYLRSAQKAFSDEESKSQVDLYKARVAQKVLEKEQAEFKLAKTKVLAVRSGIAFFTDENDWIGKPVNVGEKIITLADPNEKEILVNLPVSESLHFTPGNKIILFLNTDPTNPLNGELTEISYEPVKSNDTMFYPLKAKITDDSDFSQLGWQGTAKIYSNKKVKLFYFLFKKPISSFRQLFGW